LRRGVAPFERACVVVPPGGGPFGASFERAARGHGLSVELLRGEPVRATGTGRVRGVVVEVDRERKKIQADALVVDAPRAPAYELLEQAGAKLAHDGRGFSPELEGAAGVASGVFAVGECAGLPLDAAAIAAQAESLAVQAG
jgi:NADPH-dependent 2,4-dienoyl-CoA reductase/sulfur reductase-like enzyme